MESFLIAFNAVFPFIFYMGFGMIARKSGVVTEEFLSKITKMVFALFFPFLMFKNVYWADASGESNVFFVGFALVSVIAVILLSMLVVPRFVHEKPKQGVIVQALYRSNIALFLIPMGENLYGEKSSILAALLVAFIIPVFNVAAILILEYYRGGSAKPSVLVKKVVTNPLIIGVVIGVVFKAFSIPVPGYVAKPVRALADMVTPLCLFALGGTLHFSSIRKDMPILVPTCLMRMVGLPILMYAIMMFLPFSPMERFMLFLLFATPVATSSYPMAAAMGGDGPLAGELVVITNVFSLVTLFLFIFGFSAFGLL